MTYLSNIELSNDLIEKFHIEKIQTVHQSTIQESFFNSPYYDLSKPIIIHGFEKSEFGGCLESWTPSFFVNHLGQKDISIHSCNEPELIFSPKNFSYQKLSFEEFMQQLQKKVSDKANNNTDNNDSHFNSDTENSSTGNTSTSAPYLYYRSVSNKPTKKAANFQEDLPSEISNTFHLPQKLQLNQVESKFTIHSSILRIAQPGLQLWTHYDIPDNFLIQIKGEKRVFIFPPDQVMNLYITGSSSPAKGINVKPDFDTYPYLREALKAARWADLYPGDVLFIPSCWPHCIWMKSQNESSFSDQDHSICVSCNIFFLNSDRNFMYENKDIYGNKDYKKAQAMINKLESSIIPEVEQMPEPFSKFYLLKMASILIGHANSIHKT